MLRIIESCVYFAGVIVMLAIKIMYSLKIWFIYITLYQAK